MKQYKITTSYEITPDGELINSEKTHGEATAPVDCYINPNDPYYTEAVRASVQTRQFNIKVSNTND